MLFAYKENNIRFTQDYKSAVEKKIGKKFEKYFSEDTTAHVVLSGEGEMKRIEITIPLDGGVIRAERTSDSVHTAIDMAEEAIERQLMKHRKKLIDKYQSRGIIPEYIEENAEEEDIKIVRIKRFAMKPMDPEEACLQMDMLGHSFFVFRNAETDEINVVYKRGGETYGLIEPD